MWDWLSTRLLGPRYFSFVFHGTFQVKYNGTGAPCRSNIIWWCRNRKMTRLRVQFQKPTAATL
jgi:hypothetical protein